MALLLIGWGVIRLFEVSLAAAQNKPLPYAGVSGGEWVLIVFICLIGSGAWAARQHSWWNGGPWRGHRRRHGRELRLRAAIGIGRFRAAPHVVIEAFRGNARVVTSDQNTVTVSGNKSIRALAKKDADQANTQTPLQVVTNGDQIVVRTNQDRADGRLRVSDDLEIAVPKGASIEAHGSTGDFDITGVTGAVNITSDNAGVRLQDIGGDVRVQLDRSDIVRAVGVKGKVELRASRGDDIELDNIAGPVTISGTWAGEVQFRNLAQPLNFDGENMEFLAQKVPGQVRMSGSDFTGNSVIGPVRLSARARDIQLTDFTQGLDLDVDRGDVELRPARTSVPKMDVRVRSGDIDLALPPDARFDLKASTDRGELRNEFGSPLEVKEINDGNAGSITGAVGNGPEVRIATDRGTITIRKAGPGDLKPEEAKDVTFPDIPNAGDTKKAMK